MLKSCSYCGGIHKRGHQCPSKPNKQKKITHVDRFRWTKAWKDKRSYIKGRDKHLCQICLRMKYNTQSQYNFTDIEVHHIIPIAEDWNKRLDDDSLISLCRYHHELAESGAIDRKELLDIAHNNNKSYEL